MNDSPAGAVWSSTASTSAVSPVTVTSRLPGRNCRAQLPGGHEPPGCRLEKRMIPRCSQRLPTTVRG
ncbi:MAG: hypothetical protein ACKOFW_16555, partial [Planctomycetaceae bacterium]